jgi:simple sugar transport system permease protein
MGQYSQVSAPAGLAQAWWEKPQASRCRGMRMHSGLARFLARTKLYWGLIVIVLAGIIVSPATATGENIFLDPANLADVLRQVSIIGIMAVGMTLVILIAGIDLSVGTVMAFGSTVCAMLLTLRGWTSAALIAIPAMVTVAGLACLAIVGPILRRASSLPAAGRQGIKWFASIGAGALMLVWALGQLGGGFGPLGVIWAAASVGLAIGALSGMIIAWGRLQPFIVTLAMMVAALGAARLVAGQDQSVYPVYTGVNATEDFEWLRSLLFGILPVPGLIFLGTVIIFHVLLTRFRFGRYIYAIGGNEEAARLSGIAVNRVKIIVFALSGMLACSAGVLYAAQYRQGKPDAGTGMELDAIAAVVIGGTNLMGGRGSIAGTLVGVLIFGLLSNILQLRNIDANTQLVLKGVIIVGAVLLQEGSFRQWFGKRIRHTKETGLIGKEHHE